jgi:hypothetical protein
MNEDTPTHAEIVRTELTELENIVGSLLGSRTHTEEVLVEQVRKYRPLAGPHLSDDDCDALIRRLVQRLNIDVELGVAVVADDFQKWIEDKRSSIDWSHWLVYKQWLINQKRPWRVVDKMDELTQDILEFAGDPTLQGPWQRRGLVIGDVQSGKTSTYLGLLNKAVDAGYRLIIVLAGHTESLRQQTQERIDEGFIGRDSRVRASRPGVPIGTDRFIGIGALRNDLANAIGMTTVLRDFRKSSQEATNISVSAGESRAYVFVVKKNKSVLEALGEWLSQQPLSGGKLEVPLLLLDDESDYASVNTREETNPTAINNGIREILSRFSRSSYVGFTATPFANIFIDDENTKDLFPRDFIYSLESPSNYVGADATFGTPDKMNDEKVIDLVDVSDEFPIPHKSTHMVEGLPESLLDAIRAFVLTNSIRDLRGDDGARSMLVNVSRFKRVQGQVFDLVDEELSALRNAIQLHSVEFAEGTPNADLDKVRSTFEELFSGSEFQWTEILSALPSAVADIRVQLFNSDKDRKLVEEEIVWDRPQRLIAVGGDVLSRGLTLDGLSTSYFYRNAQASDTLLQMARWFGYRQGYDDLCRLWIDPGVAADYRFVAESVAQLRRDLRIMHSQELSPEFFGLAVKKHPGALLITARNKMKSAETRHKSISLVAQRIETTRLSPDSGIIDENMKALERLIGTLEDSEISTESTSRGYNMWRAVPKSSVAAFLRSFRAHPSDELFFDSTLGRFVASNPDPKMLEWDIVLVNGAKDEGKNPSRTVSSTTFFPPMRQITKGSAGELRVSGNSSRLAGSDDLRTLLAPAVVADVVDSYRREHGTTTMPETEYYVGLERPALLLYALRPKEARDARQRVALDPERLLVAVKLAIPGRRIDALQASHGDAEYAINSVAQRLWFVEYAVDSSEDDIDE